MITIRPTVMFPEDCHTLVSNLRAHDRAEMEASRGGITAEDMIDSAWRSKGSAMSAHCKDGLVCIYGVAPSSEPGVGIPWLLGTDLLDHHMKSLCKRARAELAYWHRTYPTLTNYTDRRNIRILVWLRWLGFKLVRTVPVGPNSTPFIQFLRHV